MILLETQDLFYSHRKRNLLKKINVSFSSNERIAIQGPSGAGKSCLLAILCGIAKPFSGRVLCKIKACSSLRDRSAIGYIPQDDFFLENESILSNAMLAVQLTYQTKKEIIQDCVIEWLRFLDIPLDARPYELSGGEKRKISIIRALALKPTILLADEWTSGLDLFNQTKVWSLFEECSSVICVTHDPKVISQCNRIYYMDKGRLTTL